MKKLRIIHSAVHAGVVGICWAVFENLDAFKAYISGHKVYAIPILLAGLALLFRSSDKVAKLILEKIPLLSPALRRMLIGREYVEGDWSLVVVDMNQLKPLYFGFLTIGFKDGQLYVYGDDWDPEGAHAVSFHSIQSLYREDTLHYWYEQGASLHRPDMRGYTEIFFFPRNGLAERHSGKFLDAEHTTDIRFYAVKQAYGFWNRRQISTEQKFNMAVNLWSDLEKKIAILKKQHISADFI